MKSTTAHVARLMTKQVRTVRPYDRLNTAAQLMWDHDCGCAPVVNDAGEAIALVTDRDICMAAYTRNQPLSELAVSDAMSETVHACAPTDSIENAQRIMQQRQVRRLPVVDSFGQLVGILSLTDLARAVGSESRKEGAGLGAIEATLAAVGRPRARTEQRGQMPQ